MDESEAAMSFTDTIYTGPVPTRSLAPVLPKGYVVKADGRFEAVRNPEEGPGPTTKRNMC